MQLVANTAIACSRTLAVKHAFPVCILLTVTILISIALAAPSVLEHPGYFLLGILGAIFANSTGAGGGVVFIPSFNHLGFSDLQAVGTSVGIQCFGMTAGAIAWYRHYRQLAAGERDDWEPFALVVGLCSMFSVAGIWTVYGLNLAPPASLPALFSAFSLLLGAGILATLLLTRQKQAKARCALSDLLMLAILAYGGGMVTAWLSVGVGELIALYLILRGHRAVVAVAAAVVISAISVWSAAPEHMLLNTNAIWNIVAVAGPGAIIGGILARRLATTLPPVGLKVFIGGWLILSGLAG